MRPSAISTLTPDIGIGVVLAAASACIVWHLTGLDAHVPLLIDVRADDVWFEGDVKRVVDNMTDTASAHYRTSVHPLFSLFGLMCTKALRHIPDVTPLLAVKITIAAAAAAWSAAFFALLRLIGCRRPDAVIFSLVAASTASALFWATIPETYLFGSLTIVLVLIVAAASEFRAIPRWLDVIAAAAALSILVTNWMYALASMITRRKIPDAIQVACNSLVLVVLLWGVEKRLAPSAQFFLGNRESTGRPEPLQMLAVFFGGSAVIPDVLVVPNDSPALWPKFSLQGAYGWHFLSLGGLALIAWIALLAAGAWAAVTIEPLRRFRAALGLALLGQLTLHFLYGNETFLYVLDWMPTLVVVASMATLTRLRWPVLGLAVVFIAAAASHNYAGLVHTFEILATHRA
jgi:hypothetical protein